MHGMAGGHYVATISTLALMRAREYLDSPWHWAQRADARNAVGDSVGCFDDTAVCRCLYGAVVWAVGVRDLLGLNVIRRASIYIDTEIIKASSKYGNEGEMILWRINAYNDAPERTHAEVLVLLDAAIVRSETVI